MADNRCDYCGKYEMLPFNCKYCGGVYCSAHRLPEYHECTGLRMMKEGTWKPPVQARKGAGFSPLKKRKPKIKLPAQGYYAYILIGACVLAFILQLVVPSFTNALELSRSSLISQPWTAITYMFLHSTGNFFHILFNMIILFFFGPLLERHIGSPRFLGLYLGSGILAGVAQVLLFPASAVIGASGAIMGIMGALAVLMPNLRIFLYFIPVKLLYAVLLFAAIDLFFLGFGAGDMVARGAHLIGLAAGFLYGYLIKNSNKGTVHTYRRA